jgi:septal ring factor EnvC (AmiA/AmiB activator)
LVRGSIIVVLLLIAVAVVAQQTAPDSDEITKQKLETIQKEIEALRQEATRLNAQENSVLSQLSQFDVQVQMKTHEIELLTLRQQTTENDIAKLQQQYQTLQQNFEKQKQYLTHRLVEAYKLGELNYLKLMLRVNQSADLLRSYQYITFLAKDDTRKVQNYRELMVDLEQTRLRLEQENRNLVSLKTDLQAAQDELQKSRQEQVRLLTSIRDEKSVHLSALSDLRVAATRLQQFFADVNPLAIMPAPPENLSALSKLKGALDWPVPGRVIRQFGVYRNPRFGTTTVSNGIEIDAPEGTEVRAVCDGQVVFAEWFKGYGKSVILSHSDGYYTLYAHNSELVVQRGDIVERGQAIGKVGSTGAIEGTPSLYFEIRKKDQPVNPMEWLRSR